MIFIYFYNYSDDTSKIKTYVGEDGQIHFTDVTGADSVLPFSKGNVGTLHEVGQCNGLYNNKSITIDLSNIDGYQNFIWNISLFAFCTGSNYYHVGVDQQQWAPVASFSASYDNTNGILSVTISCGGYNYGYGFKVYALY